jgi:hypothetical protein
MEQTTYVLVYTLSVFSVVIPLLFYFFRLKSVPRQNHILAALLLVSAICDIFGYFRNQDRLTNILLFNIQDVFQFLLLAWFYHEVIFKHAKSEVIYLSVAFYILAFVILSFTTQSIFQYQNWLWSLSGAILIIYALIYYNYAASRPTHIVINPHLTSELYINGGIFFYFSLSLVLFVTVNYIVSEHDPEMSRVFWSFHNINNIIKNILFAVGIYFTGKRVITISEYEYESVKSRISTNA